jgi:hypothetical protein
MDRRIGSYKKSQAARYKYKHQERRIHTTYKRIAKEKGGLLGKPPPLH